MRHQNTGQYLHVLMVFMLINILQTPVQNDCEAHPTPSTAMVKQTFPCTFTK